MLDIKKVTQWIPESLNNHFSPEQKGTWTMRAFSLSNVPLLFLTSPKVISLNGEHCKVEIPFRKIVKNHLGSMYFGALSIGADTCVGMLAMDKIQKSNAKVSLVFKNFSIDFLKRSEGHTLFVCEEGEKIQNMVRQAVDSGERVSEPILGFALCGDERVAEFTLTLSLKVRT